MISLYNTDNESHFRIGVDRDTPSGDFIIGRNRINAEIGGAKSVQDLTNIFNRYHWDLDKIHVIRILRELCSITKVDQCDKLSISSNKPIQKLLNKICNYMLEKYVSKFDFRDCMSVIFNLNKFSFHHTLFNNMSERLLEKDINRNPVVRADLCSSILAAYSGAGDYREDLLHKIEGMLVKGVVLQVVKDHQLVSICQAYAKLHYCDNQVITEKLTRCLLANNRAKLSRMSIAHFISIAQAMVIFSSPSEVFWIIEELNDRADEIIKLTDISMMSQLLLIMLAFSELLQSKRFIDRPVLDLRIQEKIAHFQQQKVSQNQSSSQRQNMLYKELQKLDSRFEMEKNIHGLSVNFFIEQNGRSHVIEFYGQRHYLNPLMPFLDASLLDGATAMKVAILRNLGYSVSLISNRTWQIIRQAGSEAITNYLTAVINGDYIEENPHHIENLALLHTKLKALSPSFSDKVFNININKTHLYNSILCKEKEMGVTRNLEDQKESAATEYREDHNPLSIAIQEVD